MADFFIPWAIGFVFTLGWFTLPWFVQLRTGNAALVDTFWALSFPGQCALYFLLVPGFAGRQLALLAVAALWGGRLGLYLLTRTWGQAEDARYTALRHAWGAAHQWKMLRFYWFQGGFAFLLGTPFLLIQLNTTPHLAWMEWLGMAIMGVGIGGETLADKQLADFKSTPAHKGQLCDTGLWRYSRHPNYFFEWIIWVGLLVWALGSAYGYVAVIGPVMMYYFLTRVTGIAYTEAHMLRTRGQVFRNYQQRTSAFFPWRRRS
jgi:steroid 5-alpha reductase family enzyme